MDAATFQGRGPSRTGNSLAEAEGARLVGPAEYSSLIVSHRRMKRVDRRAEKLRGLEDLDTGEVFLTDERRLFEAAHVH